jgi:hypothetical protein
MTKADRVVAQVGFPAPSRDHVEIDYTNGGEKAKSGLSLAQLAAVQEFGSVNGKIPQRPFMQKTFDNNSGKTKILLGKAWTAILADKIKPRNAIAGIGVWYAAKIRETITTGEFVKNAPLTIMLKGSSKPLIDSGDLRRGVRSKVVSK